MNSMYVCTHVCMLNDIDTHTLLMFRSVALEQFALLLYQNRSSTIYLVM